MKAGAVVGVNHNTTATAASATTTTTNTAAVSAFASRTGDVEKRSERGGERGGERGARSSQVKTVHIADTASTTASDNGGGGGGGGNSRVGPPSRTGTAIATQELNDAIADFTYGRLDGKPALLAKIVITVLRNHRDYRKVLHYLANNACLSLTRAYLENKYRRLQKWLHHKVGLKAMVRVHNRKSEEKRMKVLHDKALRIQRIGRGYLGKRTVIKAAQTLYNKYIDSESGCPYW
jgi:hypothetical protein